MALVPVGPDDRCAAVPPVDSVVQYSVVQFVVGQFVVGRYAAGQRAPDEQAAPLAPDDLAVPGASCVLGARIAQDEPVDHLDLAAVRQTSRPHAVVVQDDCPRDPMRPAWRRRSAVRLPPASPLAEHLTGGYLTVGYCCARRQMACRRPGHPTAACRRDYRSRRMSRVGDETAAR